MNLEEFIYESLNQIHTALNKYKKKSGYNFVVSNDRINLSGEGINGEIIFDIAVAQSSSKKGEGGGGLMVASVGLKGKGSLSETSENTSHIKFTVRLTKIENPT